ncbi:MAG: CPBP family intramembrane metalloprotease [Acidobacteria bacterium]|nr:CPBP family intramembrane metalloprotease [Acidobacteriota bacterium]
MTPPPATPSARSILSLGIFILVVAGAAARYLFERSISPGEIAAPYTAFILLLIPYVGCGYPEIGAMYRKLGLAGPVGAALLLATVTLPPIVALVSIRGISASWMAAVGLILYGAALAGFLRWADRVGPPPNAVDVLAVLCAWLPVELGFLHGLWSHGPADPSYLIGKTLSLSVLLMGYVAIRPLEGLGYRWRFRFEDFGAAIVALSAFLIVAIPIGIATGFVVWEPKGVSWTGIVFRGMAIGLFIALPEEILFRGVIFNLLQKWTMGRYGPYPALVASSVIFGLSHLNNFPYGDMRYVVLATYAGFCYAWCYLKTGNLMGGILTHMGVDLIHRLYLVTPPQ